MQIFVTFDMHGFVYVHFLDLKRPCPSKAFSASFLLAAKFEADQKKRAHWHGLFGRLCKFMRTQKEPVHMIASSSPSQKMKALKNRLYKRPS